MRNSKFRHCQCQGEGEVTALLPSLVSRAVPASQPSISCPACPTFHHSQNLIWTLSSFGAFHCLYRLINLTISHLHLHLRVQLGPSDYTIVLCLHRALSPSPISVLVYLGLATWSIVVKSPSFGQILTPRSVHVHLNRQENETSAFRPSGWPRCLRPGWSR